MNAAVNIQNLQPN
jgi:hypothetical protein